MIQFQKLPFISSSLDKSFEIVSPIGLKNIAKYVFYFHKYGFFLKLKPLIDISGYHLLDVNTMHLFKRHSKRCLVLLGTKTDFQIS